MLLVCVTLASRSQFTFVMLAPSGVLTVVVIVVPLAVALYISLLDLDQYSFREWVSAPFIGLHNYVEALRTSDLVHSIWVSVSYATVVTLVILPVGGAAALATHNRFPGRGLVRSVFLVPYVLPAFVLGVVWRVVLQPAGVANTVLARVGVQDFNATQWFNGNGAGSGALAVVPEEYARLHADIEAEKRILSVMPRPGEDRNSDERALVGRRPPHTECGCT